VVPDAVLPGLDALPDGVVIVGSDRRVVVLNSAARRFLGAASRDLVGRLLVEALPFTDAAGRDWWQCTDPYGGLATRTRQPEVELFLPDGTGVLVTASFHREGGPRTAVTSVLLALRSSSARDRLDRDRADLVATVAHELRSPLTSVKGFTSTLLSRWERFTDAQRRLMLETVEADADRVTRLITELLDIGRIDSGRLELHRSLVHLPALVQRHIDGLVAHGESADRFVVVAERALPETWADSDKLDQVVANLLENALRHGAGRVTITLEPAQIGGEPATELTVADEGPGVPADQARRVFHRFWRGGQRSGSGLGLYIVRGLIEAHGGSVALVSKPDEGAAFRVLVPAGKEPG